MNTKYSLNIREPPDTDFPFVSRQTTVHDLPGHIVNPTRFWPEMSKKGRQCNFDVTYKVSNSSRRITMFLRRLSVCYCLDAVTLRRVQVAGAYPMHAGDWQVCG
jgi:hypothetical protein